MHSAHRLLQRLQKVQGKALAAYRAVGPPRMGRLTKSRARRPVKNHGNPRTLKEKIMKGILSIAFVLSLFAAAGCVEQNIHISICPEEATNTWEFICEDGQVYSYIAEVRYDGIEEDDLCDSLQ